LLDKKTWGTKPWLPSGKRGAKRAPSFGIGKKISQGRGVWGENVTGKKAERHETTRGREDDTTPAIGEIGKRNNKGVEAVAKKYGIYDVTLSNMKSRRLRKRSNTITKTLGGREGKACGEGKGRAAKKN